MKTRIIGAVLALALAVVGAFVLVTYVRGSDARAAAGAELADVFIVESEIPQGTNGEAIQEYVRVDQMPTRNLNEDRVTDLADLDGLVSLTSILPGEQLLTSRFAEPAVLAAQGEVPIPEGMQEVTIPLSVQRVVGGEIRAGATVGVVYTTNTNSMAANTAIAYTQFLFHRMLVTRVAPGDTVAVGDGESSATEVSTLMITLAATTPQVEKLVYAAEQHEDSNGGIWLTLEPETAEPNGSVPRYGENIFG